MGFLADLLQHTSNALTSAGIATPELGLTEKTGGASVAPNHVQDSRIDFVKPVFVGGGNKEVPFDNPYFNPENYATPTGGAATGGSGGGSSYDPAAIAYYNDQEAQARQAIARLNAQRGIGQGNIANSYQSAFNSLLGNNATAERDAGLVRQRTIDDNVAARSNVDQTVARQAAGLRRLLGNSSSAAQFAAPLAVARQGNQQQGAIQTTFGRNLQGIDIADEDRKRQFGQAQEDLINQRTQQENALNAGILQNEAGLNETLSSIALQRAQAQGQNYAQARGALTPYNDRVSSLLAQIDQLGANPAIAAKNVAFTAPTLDQYNTSGIKVAAGNSPVQAQTGQYANLLNEDRKKRTIF